MHFKERAHVKLHDAQLQGNLAKIKGKREQLEGFLQQRYGYAKDKAKSEVDQWSKSL